MLQNAVDPSSWKLDVLLFARNPEAYTLQFASKAFDGTGFGAGGVNHKGEFLPKGSMYLYSRYLGLKGVPIQVL